MTGFIPVSIERFVEQYVRNNKGSDPVSIRAAAEDALAAWRQGVRCACGKPIWVAGSAVAGYGCFSCITGSVQPEGDPEIEDACSEFLVEKVEREFRMAQVDEIMKNHPVDWRDRLEDVGFAWYEDDYDMLYEEEEKEEALAVPETENQRHLIQFLDSGGPVTQRVLDAYLHERYAEDSNTPLVRKYFKKANPHLKAILLRALELNPTDVDLLDDLSYFSEFDSMLGELICFYTDACMKETNMERFSLLAQDFHMNTCEHGYDALQELVALFPSGVKGAVIQHLWEAIEEHEGPEGIPF
jgi:hypothetical protein